MGDTRLGIIGGTIVYAEERFGHISDDLEREATALLDAANQQEV